MTLIDSISICFSKYITFSGRARQSEFWWFMLFIGISSAVLNSVDYAIFGRGAFMMGEMNFSYNLGISSDIFTLATFLPIWADQVRLLHDIGKTGWWLLLALIPLIGTITLFFWMIRKGTDGSNAYGANQLA